MTQDELEDFWCTPNPPVLRVWFDDKSGFSCFFVLMADGSISAHVDSAAGCGVQVLAEALAYLRS